MQSVASEDVALPRSRTLFKRLELLLAVAIAACVVANTVAAFRQISRPYEVDYEEGNVLNACLRLLQGQTPYPPPDQLPSALNPYGPVAYGILAVPLSFHHPSFTPGRVLVLGFCILAAVLIALILRSEDAGWRVALLFGGLYLTFPAVQDWMFLLRVDYLGVAFSLFGLLIFAKGIQSGRSWAGASWLWCVPFFALGFFTKITFLAAPASCFVYLLWRKEVRKALLLSGSLLGTLAMMFLLVQRWSDGWFFFHNFRTHPDPYTLSHLLHVGRGLVSQIVPLTLGSVYAVRRLRSGVPSLPAIYFVLALLTSLTAGKVGSSTNHFLELLAACAICAGLFYMDFLRQHESGSSEGVSKREVRWVVLATISMAVSALVLVPMRAVPQLEAGRDEYTGCRNLYEYVREHQGTKVLSENAGAVVLAGKPVIVSNPFVYGQLAMHGGGSDEQLRLLLESRYFDLVVLADSAEGFQAVPSVVWSPALLASVERHYRPVRQFTCAYGRVAYERKP